MVMPHVENLTGSGFVETGSSWDRVGRGRVWILGGRKLKEAAGSGSEAVGIGRKQVGISWKRPEEVGSMVGITWKMDVICGRGVRLGWKWKGNRR